MKMLFAPIGNPKEYQCVCYKVDSNTFNTKASFKAIEQAYNIQDIIIYAGLSLCDISKYKDYSSCSEDISRNVKSMLDLDNETIIVAPNIYGDKYVQTDRKSTLYFNFIYYNTLKILEQKTSEQKTPDSIYIDITYGINYMPLLATDAIKLAAYTYVIEKKSPIDLAIFNSEPVIRNNPGPYNIDKVFTEKIDVRQALLSILMPFLSNENKNNITNKALKYINNHENTNNRENTNNCKSDLIYSIANALFSGIFPFLILSKNEIEKCKKDIDDRMGILDYKEFKVEIVVNDKLVYNDIMPIELSYLHSLLTVIEKIIDNRLSYNNGEYRVKISDIKDVAENFSTSETVLSLVLNEIDKIESNNGITEEHQLLADIENNGKTGGKTGNNGHNCNADKRNLFAHGGFEKNVTYLWKENGEIYMNYGECKESVENHLK